MELHLFFNIYENGSCQPGVNLEYWLPRKYLDLECYDVLSLETSKVNVK